MSIAKRLADARSKAGLSQQELADIVGVSQQSIGKIEAGKTTAPRKITEMAQALGVSAHWLQFGAQEENGQFIDLNVKDWSDVPDDPYEFVNIPILDIELSAGCGSNAEIIESEVGTYPFRRDELNRYGVNAENARLVKIIGNSLYPVLNSGDMVAIDITSRRIKDGDLYAIRDGVLLRVKILVGLPDGGLIVRSFNSEEYPDEVLNYSHTRARIHIIGRVFWSSRRW